MAFSPTKFLTGGAAASAMYQKGLAAFEAGDYAAAIERLSEIAEAQNLPGTLARFYLGRAHHEQGIRAIRSRDFAAAARHLAVARQINPDSSGLSRYLAACYAAQGRFDLAAAELERGLESGDGERALPIRLAYALVRDGQFDRAVATLERAAAADRTRPDLPFHLGILHGSEGDYHRAIECFRRAAALAPGDADAQRHLALALASVNDLPAAVEHLSLAQRQAPRDAYTAWLLAQAAQDAAAAGRCPSFEPAGSTPEPEDPSALEALGEMITRDPDFVESFLSLPPSEVDQEVFGVIAATLERALDRHPDYADLHHHCSRVYERLNRSDRAAAAAREAIRINPRYVQALIQLARLCQQSSQDDEAIERLGAAIDAGGDYPDVHFMLGELFRKRGRRHEAAKAYRRALELNSAYARAAEALSAVSAA